jgi:hypothetical protein
MLVFSLLYAVIGGVRKGCLGISWGFGCVATYAWEVAPYVKISSPKHAPCSVEQAEMLPFLFLWIAF